MPQNDAFQEAQHNYLGPEWAAFFASLAGKRVNMGGFGRAGTSLGETGRPGDEDTARSLAINQYLGDMTDQRRAQDQALRAQTAAADLHQSAARQALSGEQDQAALDRALATGGQPGRPIVQNPDGSYATGAPPKPATPMEQRQRLLAMVPGHVGLAMQKQWAAQDADAQKAQLERDKLTETQRKDRATEAANAPFVPPVDASGAPLMGEALLQTLPTSKQKLVTAVLEGRQSIPSGTALKDPYWKGVLETANLIDPNFDTVNYNARANTRKDFTSGAASKQINAINTVVGHLHDLSSEGSKLDNTGVNWINAIRNKLTTGGSDRGVAINNFETLKEGVATELMRTWRQVGAGSEKEIEDWKSTISSAKSPQELQGAFKTIGGMIESKLLALDKQYQQGMGTDKVTAITPESRRKLDALQGIKGGTVGGTVTLQAPDGSTRDVPADQADHYIGLGAKRVGG